MYSESDIEAAVASGALTAEAAASLRTSVASGRQTSSVDEESFRLITGFNDIFVSIAAILLLVAVGWIGSSIGGAFTGVPGNDTDAFRYIASRSMLGSTAVAVTAWLLAEYFTRVRRMALPSIILLAAFALGTAGLFGSLFSLFVQTRADPRTAAVIGTAVGLITAGAIYAHWRRFHVPITIAALTGALVSALVSLVFSIVPGSINAYLWVLLIAGIAVFGFAMWWDMSDRARITRRSDVAFWLHLAAAPMIAHPIFNLLGVTHGLLGPGTALVVMGLYLIFGVIALATDRRALLVSGLLYVLVALENLFEQFGAVSLNIALTALVIGSALLMLSAFWHTIRRMVVTQLPPGLQARLPELDRPAYVAPLPA